jgi:heterodisulfide reductase subunit B
VICPSCFDEFDVGQLRLAKKTGREEKLPAVYFFQLLALAQGADPSEVGLDRHKVKADVLLGRDKG